MRSSVRPTPSARRGAALGLAAGLLLALAAPAAAQDADPVVVRVNGTEIRASDVAVAEEEIGPSLQQVPPESRREYVISYLTDTTLVAQAAEARKLADTPD